MEQIYHILYGQFKSDDGLREIFFSPHEVTISLNGETIERFFNSGQFYPKSKLFTFDQVLKYYYLQSNNKIAVGVIKNLAIIERDIKSELNYSRV
jgi:hypothetical protein